MAEIDELGVPCYSGSCSEVYLEKAFDSTGFRPGKRLPVARELGETSLMFLCHPTLTEDNVEKTCDVLAQVMAKATR
jgi:dTDP-4-amino-4,6-dideoxygalactose transaminase